MNDIGTINFKDSDSGNDSCAIVRAEHGCVGIALSQRHGGDIEAFMTYTDAKRFFALLQEALEIAGE